jgi:hypothetical protein
VSASSNYGLVDIDISRNNFEFDKPHADDTMLFETVKQLMRYSARKKIKKLNFSECNLCDSGPELLFGGLRQFISLEEVNFHSNNMTDRGFNAILKAIDLGYFKPKKLCLSSNRITGQGVSQMISKHKEGATLSELILRRNYIDNDAAMALLQHLKRNHTLTKVDISFSRKMIRPETEE